MNDESLLLTLWSVLYQQAPLNSAQASCFSKVIAVLLEKQTAAMLEFIMKQDNVVEKFISHLYCSSIGDLLLKIISMDELPDGKGIIDWLSENHLTSLLFDKLDPQFDPEIHSYASQIILDIIAVSYQNIGPPEHMLANLSQAVAAEQLNLSATVIGGNLLVDEMKSHDSVSRLIQYMIHKDAENIISAHSSGVSIIIELIRRYCSEIEQLEYQYHQHELSKQQARGNVGVIEPSPEKVYALATDLNHLLDLIGDNIDEFANLLTHPRSVRGPLDTTVGKQMPLSSERLKTCELLAEVLHLLYLYTSSPLFMKFAECARMEFESPGTAPQVTDSVTLIKDTLTPIPRLIKRRNEPGFDVADYLIKIAQKFIQYSIIPQCLTLFFEFTLNNFLHSIVYDMLAKVFNTFSYTYSILGTSQDELEIDPRIDQIRIISEKLVISVFSEGKLTSRITSSQRQNDASMCVLISGHNCRERPKGIRMGYMGHLTYISDEVCKLLEKCGEHLSEAIKNDIDIEEWEAYVDGPLFETKERDRQALGGVRPVAPAAGEHGVFGMGEAVDALPDFDLPAFPKHNTIIPDSKPYDFTETVDDQFARYLCQQIVNDLPSDLGAVEIDDADERDWDNEVEFDILDAEVSDQLGDLVAFDKGEDMNPNSSGDSLGTFLEPVGILKSKSSDGEDENETLDYQEKSMVQDSVDSDKTN